MTAAILVDRILEQLGDARARCPELRLGQLIAIVGELAQDEIGHSLWDIEDADFAAALQRFSADLDRRAANRAEPAAATDRCDVKSSPEFQAPEPPRQVS